MVTALVAISFLQRLAMVPAVYWVLWLGSLALSIALVVLLRTRWGQSRPLQKCAVLSLLVHALLACVAMTVRVVVGDGGGGVPGAPIRVRIMQDPGDAVALNVPMTEGSTDDAPELLEPTAQTPPETPINEIDTASPPKDIAAEIASEPPSLTPSDPAEPTDPVASVDPTADDEPPQSLADDPAQTPPVSNNVVANTSADPASIRALEPISERAVVDATPVASHAAQPAASPAAAAPVPDAYALRSGPGRLGLIEMQGGSAQTEAAVVAAISWLARAQSPDGRWDANRYGAGREQSVLGQNRGGAGRDADTGVSALAILAFLGAGHTHHQGDYQTNVRHGLDFIARSQAADGSLFGDATLYAQMYCHSMATFALAEAQAMTGDARWESAVTKAIAYSLRAQHPVSGGWRYRPGDTGDTSQLGWQLMALASAERAGIEIPARTWARAQQFLKSVERGNHGGLASYRPDGPHSTSMTAEALYCRLLLEEGGYDRVDEAAADEATRQLLAALPSDDRINLYYWYYATLALHHRHDVNANASDAWATWNDALTTALTRNQLTDGPQAGSWDTNTVWGGYGGRIYTTSMAAMCLEAYYRYAPTEPRRGWTATRPSVNDPSR